MQLQANFEVSPDPRKYPDIGEEFLDEHPEILRDDIEEWKPIDCNEVDNITVVFVDGVRRTEILIRFEDKSNALISYGAFVSVGAGALFMTYRRTNHVWDSLKCPDFAIKRYFVVDKRVPINKSSIDIEVGKKLSFEVIKTSGNLSEKVNELMADLEHKVAESIYNEGTQENTLIITDGPLRKSGELPIIGYVKRQLRAYLPADKMSLLLERELGGMKVGQRTPIVHVKLKYNSDRNTKSFEKYIWYVKISEHQGLSGLARLEASADLDLEKVRELANKTAFIIPKFASSEFTDFRAPHNLLSIKHLENLLRCRLGNHTLIRRSIEAKIISESFF